ncbi:uncharacterized protein LOC142583553 [Dermacentor variabilis]|uniref:uncharacterized protein LOC142583553 n=1 Tax=Dermacentor variabilis TaxID=34621 RepID=UPI003F5C0210
MLYCPSKEGFQKQDGVRSTTNLPQHFVIRHTTDEPESPGGHRPQSPVHLPPALFTLPPKATNAVVERNKKAKEVAKKKKKKRRHRHHKPTEVVRGGGTKEGGKAPTVVTDNQELYLGIEDVLPTSLPGNHAHEPVTTVKLTKNRPSIVELREEFRKMAHKPTMSTESGNAAAASSTLAGPSPPSSALRSKPAISLADKVSDKSRETAEKSECRTSGHVTATSSTPGHCDVGRTSGESCTYLVTALVMLGLAAGLVLLLTTLLLDRLEKRAAVSRSVKANTSSRRARPVFGFHSGGLTMPLIQ